MPISMTTNELYLWQNVILPRLKEKETTAHKRLFEECLARKTDEAYQTAAYIKALRDLNNLIVEALSAD